MEIIAWGLLICLLLLWGGGGKQDDREAIGCLAVVFGMGLGGHAMEVNNVEMTTRWLILGAVLSLFYIRWKTKEK
jgi:hypothetical protein